MDAIVLFPSFIAIVLAIWSRQVYIALAAGIFSASLILSGHFTLPGIAAAMGSGFDAIADTFADTSSMKSMIFILCIGAMIRIMGQTGGIYRLIDSLVKDKGKSGSKAGAQLSAFAFGLIMCLEGVGSMMMVGLIGRPLFDKNKLSRTQLAFVANGTGAPIAWLVPFGGAGVFLTGLLATLIHNGYLADSGVNSAYHYMIQAIPYQFYTILMLIMVFFFALRGKDIQQSQSNVKTVESQNPQEAAGNLQDIHRANGIFSLMLPLLLLLVSMIVITIVTGKGSFIKGDISSAIYYSGFVTLIGSGFYYILRGVKINTYFEWCISGIQQMVPAVTVLILAFTLGRQIGQLGVSQYLAGFVSGNIPLWLFPALVFIICMLISFSTGSSGATVSIMVPVIIPLAVTLGLGIPMVLGAVISGAVFGDQSSPISDSVIVASTAADCPPEEHFRTQVPYTSLVAGLSLVMFIAVGVIT